MTSRAFLASLAFVAAATASAMAAEVPCESASCTIRLRETGSAVAETAETMSTTKKNNRTSLDRDLLFIESSWNDLQ